VFLVFGLLAYSLLCTLIVFQVPVISGNFAQGNTWHSVFNKTGG